MLWLSELLMEHHELKSFAELKEKLSEQVKQGEMFFSYGCATTFSRYA